MFHINDTQVNVSTSQLFHRKCLTWKAHSNLNANMCVQYQIHATIPRHCCLLAHTYDQATCIQHSQKMPNSHALSPQRELVKLSGKYLPRNQGMTQQQFWQVCADRWFVQLWVVHSQPSDKRSLLAFSDLTKASTLMSQRPSWFIWLFYFCVQSFLDWFQVLDTLMVARYAHVNTRPPEYAVDASPTPAVITST